MPAKTYLKNGINEIIAYKANIEKIVKEKFGDIYDQVVLNTICPMIEFIDNFRRSYENNKEKKFWGNKIAKARVALRQFNFINQEEINLAIDSVAQMLVEYSKSSSLIECVNSIIRRFLVTYKSIPEWFCPLFTYYWNHRTFARGKRKGLKPIEILMENDWPNDWLEEILNDFPFEPMNKDIRAAIAA